MGSEERADPARRPARSTASRARQRPAPDDGSALSPGRSRRRSVRGTGWLSLELLREVISRLHRGWEALPRTARRRWWTTLAVGVLGELAVVALLVRGTRSLEAAGALTWEPGVLQWVSSDFPLSFSAGMWLEGPGNGFVLWALMLYAAGMAAWMGRPLRAIALLLGYTLIYVPIGVGWWMWDRARPDFILQGIGSPGAFFHSFPSGHVAQTVFAYGILVWFWIGAASRAGERWFAAGTFLLLVAIVALGRLRIGAHWPTDLGAGVVIGLVWVAAVAAALHRAEGSTPASPRPPDV